MLSFFKNIYILKLNSFKKKKACIRELIWCFETKNSSELKIFAAGVQVESETHQILKLLRLSTKYSHVKKYIYCNAFNHHASLLFTHCFIKIILALKKLYKTVQILLYSKEKYHVKVIGIVRGTWSNAMRIGGGKISLFVLKTMSERKKQM